MIEEYFSIDDNGLPIMKPIIKNIKSFKLILQADKGSVGDHDGMKKLKAQKELTFIYLYCNKNMFIGYSQKQRMKICLTRAGLPNDYVLNDYVKFAINELLEDIETPVQKSVRVLRQTLLNFVDVLDRVGKRTADTLEFVDSVNVETMSEDDLKLRKKYFSELEDDLSKTLKYNTDLPKAIDQLEILESKLKKEVSDEKIKGNKVISRFEDE